MFQGNKKSYWLWSFLKEMVAGSFGGSLSHKQHEDLFILFKNCEFFFLTLLISSMEKSFVTDKHFNRSRRFITLAVFHFQIEMSRNYPISLFIITSNTFSVQFHTVSWFIAFARLIEIWWYYKRWGCSLNPLSPGGRHTEHHGKYTDSETFSRKQLTYVLFTCVSILSYPAPNLEEIGRFLTAAESLRKESLRKLY